jgi:hypothetical protein
MLLAPGSHEPDPALDPVARIFHAERFSLSITASGAVSAGLAKWIYGVNKCCLLLPVAWMADNRHMAPVKCLAGILHAPETEPAIRSGRPLPAAPKHHCGGRSGSWTAPVWCLTFYTSLPRGCAQLAHSKLTEISPCQDFLSPDIVRSQEKHPRYCAYCRNLPRKHHPAHKAGVRRQGYATVSRPGHSHR